MDPGFPRGGIERVFAQYDRITSHHPPEEAHEENKPDAPKDQPKPDEPKDQPKPDDEPPWWSPDDQQAQQVPVTALPPDPLENGASGGFGKLVGSGLAIRAIQAQSSLRAALPELAEPLLGEAGAAAAEGAALGIADLAPGLALGAMTYAGLKRAERNQYKNSAVEPGEVTFEVDGKSVPAKTFHQSDEKVSISPVSFKGDEKGLDNAYANPQGTSYDAATKTMYIKGSSTATDWLDDFRTIPFGDTAQSERYGQAMDAYNHLTTSGKPVDRVVGHSLGGSVALELQKNLSKQGRKVDSRTFGAPVMDAKPFDRYYNNAERYRHPTDPVSVLDRGAKWGKYKPYSHSYAGFQDFDKV